LATGIKSALNDQLRGRLTIKTYPGRGEMSRLNFADLNGIIGVDYTPFQGLDPADNCRRMAAAQVLVNPETEANAALYKNWVALDNQLAVKRDVACE
jgi:hypothetical protein